MIWYITFKDIASFFFSKKKVFIWLVICMICGSFVLNYSYSFARYRGEVYEYNSDAGVERYKINGTSSTSSAKKIPEQINDGDFAGVNDYQLFRRSDAEPVVVGSSFISERSSAFTGSWTEGYYSEESNIVKMFGKKNLNCLMNSNAMIPLLIGVCLSIPVRCSLRSKTATAIILIGRGFYHILKNLRQI